MLDDHVVRQKGDATEVELSFSCEGLLAGLIGALYGKKMTEYVKTEALSLKTKCEA